MLNPESVWEKETHKTLRDFEIQTDHLISARRPDLVILNKKKKKKKRKKRRTCQIVDFAVSANHRVNLKESEKIDKYLDLARELKKTIEYVSDGDTNCNWCAQYCHQRISRGTGELGNKRTSGDHPNYSIIKISQNNEKSSGDLRRLTVAQTPMRNHQLTLVWKTLII